MSLKTVVDILRNMYRHPPPEGEFLAIDAVKKNFTPIGTLISIVLTQNTSDKNAWKALQNLINFAGPSLSSEKLSQLSVKDLEKMIQPSGMYRVKAKTILNILSHLNDDVLSKTPPNKLRNILISIPGIGPKTADVFLAVARKYPTFPIDTHVRRVLTRLGYIGPGMEYEDIRRKVIEDLPPEELIEAHILLIRHGRAICRARNPKCEECPLRNYCRYYRKRT